MNIAGAMGAVKSLSPTRHPPPPQISWQGAHFSFTQEIYFLLSEERRKGGSEWSSGVWCPVPFIAHTPSATAGGTFGARGGVGVGDLLHAPAPHFQMRNSRRM